MSDYPRDLLRAQRDDLVRELERSCASVDEASQRIEHARGSIAALNAQIAELDRAIERLT